MDGKQIGTREEEAPARETRIPGNQIKAREKLDRKTAAESRDTDTEAREAYRRELLREMEGEILRRTVRKAEVITRSMRPGEK